jgi:hypothetical protein
LAAIIEAPMPEVLGAAGSEAERRDRQAQIYTHTLTAAALDWLAHNPCDAIYERYSLWSDTGARLRAATGLPLVLEVNAPLRQEAVQHRRYSDDTLAAQIEATQFAAADFLAVVSEPLAEYVVTQGANPANVHVLPNGVDPNQFHPAVRGGDVREQVWAARPDRRRLCRADAPLARWAHAAARLRPAARRQSRLPPAAGGRDVAGGGGGD